ncbi:AraC family transcriptional regulator [Paenibacillus lutrae]|uniref:AraC family transcriptional regulator n=1 Tax=Paenibacillus lutrae TaxID=2078573 RepID=UPI001F492AAF|nr:AraC family transcriptional regulator [Paenibacillus lutrae]
MNQSASGRNRSALAEAFIHALYRVKEVEIIRAESHWRMDYQHIESHVLLVVTAGRGLLNWDGEKSKLWEERVHICRPGQVIGIQAGEGGLELTLVRFELFRSDEEAGGYSPFIWQEEQVVPVKPVPQFAITCEALGTHWQNESPYKSLQCEAAFLELMYITAQHIELETRLDSINALERTRRYIDAYYHTPITIDELARMAEISPKYYGDLFKKTYGIRVVDYLTAQRINRAKQLMVLSQSRLKDIAHIVGYQDEFYFSRKFKQEVGVSPSAYMKSRKRKIAVHHPHLTGHLLALHYLPYAAPLHPKWTGFYYEHYRRDIPVHLSAYRYSEDWQSNIDKIREVRPDVILSMDTLNPGEKEKLEQAGPVLYIPNQQLDWREQLKLVANYLEVSGEADSWLTKYDRRVQSLKDMLHERMGEDTFLIISLHKSGMYSCGTRSMGEVFYGDLAMKPSFSMDLCAVHTEIKPEQLIDINPDHILVNICQEPETLDNWRNLQTTPFWRDLKAVRHNRVHSIPSDPWREYSAMAHARILDETERLFLRE